VIEGLFSCSCHIDGIRLLAQALRNESRNPRIIFHKEKPHESIIRQKEGNEASRAQADTTLCKDSGPGSLRAAVVQAIICFLALL
jgi:hypothetical protein